MIPKKFIFCSKKAPPKNGTSRTCSHGSYPPTGKPDKAAIFGSQSNTNSDSTKSTVFRIGINQSHPKTSLTPAAPALSTTLTKTDKILAWWPYRFSLNLSFSNCYDTLIYSQINSVTTFEDLSLFDNDCCKAWASSRFYLLD